MFSFRIYALVYRGSRAWDIRGVALPRKIRGCSQSIKTLTSSKDELEGQLFFVLFFSPAPEVKFNHSKEQDTSATIRTTVAPIPIDESQPVTSIQIRLADGTRYV